jgi:16S rRNA (uracil1498-N3)-methyltransferase
MTTSFYVPPDGFRGNAVTFPVDEAKHAAGVLRHRPGDIVRVVDGRGRAVFVRLDTAERGGVAGTIIEEDDLRSEPPIEIILAVGLVKHRARFEMLLEKVTELGVSRIVPLITDRTERDRHREDRAQSILVSAMKQSHRSFLPRLDAPVEFEAFVASSDADIKLLCHEAEADAERSVVIEDQSRVLITVGPEGGFSDDEVAMACDGGFLIWQLGRRRLRAETAAIAAVSAVVGASETSIHLTTEQRKNA